MLLAIAALVAGSGCGKSDLSRSESSVIASGQPSPRAPMAPRVTSGAPVPLPLTARRAGSFARAVSLGLADLPGASVEPSSKAPREEEREAGRCGSVHAKVLGGAQSPKLGRGVGLDRETLSSSVAVLASERLVSEDIAYANSPAGLTCYARVLGRSLSREATSRMRVGRVRVQRIVRSAPAQQAGAGLRISARVSLEGGRLSLSIYIDALAFGYGPAEVNIYATSFVEPEPIRTEQELLTLLRERARRAVL
jgi:hypothetical protein